MSLARGRVLSVNVGGIRRFDYKGRQAVSAIWKSPVSGRVAARGVNLEGDDQADRQAHGGPDKAVYAYAVEDAQWWESHLGRPFEFGQFGENLTTEGLDLTGALIGEVWEVGTVRLEVSEPRVPCWRLGVRMEDKKFPARFVDAGRPGTYLRIRREGELGAGDEISVVERPDHGVTVGEMFRIYFRERERAELLLSVSQVSEPWKQWAQKVLGRKGRPSKACGTPGC